MGDKIAKSQWAGAGKNGKGRISTETGALKDYPYGFASTMALSIGCDKSGYATTSLESEARVRLGPDAAPS